MVQVRWLVLAAALTSAAQCEFLSAIHACPDACDMTSDSSDWTLYNRVDRLNACNKTMLLDFALHNPLDNPKAQPMLFACTLDSTTNSTQQTSLSCDSNSKFVASPDLVWSGDVASESSEMAVSLVETIHEQLRKTSDCDTTLRFAYSQKIVVGVYAGEQIQPQSVTDEFLPKFISYLKSAQVPRRLALQHCATDAEHTVGIVIDTTGDLAGVQDVVRGWRLADSSSDWEHEKKDWSQMTLQTSQKLHKPQMKTSAISAQASCDYITVFAGNLCPVLAKSCGISEADLAKFNPKKDLCTTLTAGQIICCSKGDVPDLKPKPKADGTCFTYKTIREDTCFKIAAANRISVKDIESFNKETWGWSGCDALGYSQIMCLSKGDPPMPAELSNAVCGPQVSGTKKPTDRTKLAELNPCKLNACCNIWGQCGITDDFCTESNSTTGAPGTAAEDENGCISNCGNHIKPGTTEPPDFKMIVYFEAWNSNRPCMNMDVTDIPSKGTYSHVHFAFANITKDLEVDIEDVKPSFNAFVGMKDFNRILSFGGWAFSTAPETFPIFRQGVTDAQRQKFADNVVAFLKLHNLDGLDFDWEYPGAPDLPDIPAGSPEDGANYLKFLKMVKKQLPKGKSLSVAMPASYWYLRGFDPIPDFADVVDYVIYMTYDLHGQWDYDNSWAIDGCPDGNCLRSHVNVTEARMSMSMIQKAGMPAEKVVVGVASYGRSFKMTKEGCSGPMCTYTGPKSGARKGRCTDTAGYLSTAEINEIIDTNPDRTSTFDKASYSDILVYNKTEYVAYMSQDRKTEWELMLLGRGWGGVSDWAVDLMDMYTQPSDEEIEVKYCGDSFDTLVDLSKAGDDVPHYCVNIYALGIMSKDFRKAMSTYTDLLDDGYDDKFDTYEKYVNETMRVEVEDYMKHHAEDRFHCIDTNDENKKTVACPTTLPTDHFKGPDEITYVLDDEKGFYKDMMDKYGIDESWIKFGDLWVWVEPGCHPSGGGNSVRNCELYWHGWPNQDDDRMKVPNPKETISGAMKNLTDFGNQLDESAYDASAFLYTEDIADAIQAAEMPLFMTESAIEQMQKVMDTADKITAEYKKEMIINFAAALVMLVPAVGETIGTLGLATIGRVVMLAGEAGNAAFGVYGIVEDPKSAVFSIFGALIGVRGEMGFARAAEARRSMSEKENSALGKYVQGRMDGVKSVQQRSCKA
ncbi:Glycoside hydrolase superfamily [Penicillium robsamsonii]|uniref:Glycoside hydrolase superfamily n=1 Tax=Penicillium robsamsonii TaxID=1792511 RepID=UPI00254667B3|nr:Glycoside hydrolase superfamily [Penicillium robsamsonii]KAJ5827672.1 Glycoside hydrolase superfamily [Penicillium robsamsonii]